MKKKYKKEIKSLTRKLKDFSRIKQEDDANNAIFQRHLMRVNMLNKLRKSFLMHHDVTSDDAVELRFEDETVVVYCNEISPLGWLKLFHKHKVEVVPCKIKRGKVFYD